MSSTVIPSRGFAFYSELLMFEGGEKSHFNANPVGVVEFFM